jgi:GT2 family glycosyltransferase
MPTPNITFCINTAINERHHLELLFRSLCKNLSRHDYPILVYVENDNQDSVGYLRFVAKEQFPNLKIIKNPLPVPLDYSRNINMMFEMAETEVVSYLQSDMVICPLYDLEIARFLTPDTVISATRIEPPLHPPSPEKITRNFGMDPTKFDLEAFSEFAKASKSDKTTDYWFAPWTIYKKNWVSIGGHDTLFRRSRVDSDLLYRFSMMGLKIVQVWNASVYHFTCTSSRGPEWWTDKAKERTRLQEQADAIEMFRFFRKWPKFKHSSIFDPETEYMYQISANFQNAAPADIDLLRCYFMFHRIHVDNPTARQMIHREFDHLQDPANKLQNFTTEQWNYYKKYYRTWEYEDIFSETPITDDDVIYVVDLKGQPLHTIINNPVFSGRQLLVHTYRNESPGEFELDTPNVKIILNRAINRIRENLVVKNPSVSDIPFEIV